jgi:NitT/TauT family transport system ATP-binding protein
VTAALEISGVRKVFPGRRKGQGDVEALGGIDIALAQNEFVSIVGASGCGKSTLLSIVAGLEVATSGSVAIEGTEIAGPDRDRGVVFQRYTLLPWLTALDNVEFGLRKEPMNAAQRRERAAEMLHLVGLDGFADRYPAELSGGMQQRVALARALAYRPKLLLMDEPFGALDALTRRVMQGLLTQVWEEHRLTVLFITHDIEESVFLSDRVLVMSSRPGRIKEEIAVDLPRPRTYELLADGAFHRLQARVFESIRQEAEAAMNQSTER